MFSTIVSDYPWYCPFLCAIASAVLTAVAYYKNKKLTDFKPFKIYLLSALRFLAMLFTMLLLLDIFVKSISRHVEKPVLAIAVDNSESMLMRGPQAPDSVKSFATQIHNMATSLSDKYNVRIFSFGEGCKPIVDISTMKYSQQYTDISQMLESMQSTLYNTNTGALVICSDGIYNRGQNPMYNATGLGKKIHTVTLGDTSAYKDLAVTKTIYNETVFLGNEFPIEITVNSRMLKGSHSVLEVIHNGKTEFSQSINAASDSYSAQISASLKANTKGLQKYTVNIRPVDGEITTINNSRDVLIDVVDDKRKVLILSSMPHPDVAAIRNALSANRGIETECVTVDALIKPISQYDLVVMVQVPALGVNSDKVMQDIKVSGVPVLYVLGTSSDFEKFNSVNGCVVVNKKGNNFEDATASENGRFSLMTFENGVGEFVEAAPPLCCAFGDYNLSARAQSFLLQSTRGIVTDKPLIAISDPSGKRSAVVAGEGLWRWRIDCFRRYQNHEKFDLMISRLCQYLFTRTDRERFSIAARRIFGENEPVYFNAKVLDDKLEPDANAKVDVKILHEDGSVVDTYPMEPTNFGFYLRADNLEPGSYTYISKAVSDGKTFTKSGVFSVMEINAESENLVANRALMDKIAGATGGHSYSPNEIEDLQKMLANDESIKPMVYSDMSMASLLTYRWLFVLIITLFSVEWFLRKYWGTI